MEVTSDNQHWHQNTGLLTALDSGALSGCISATSRSSFDVPIPVYEGAKHPTPLTQTPPFPLNPNPGPSLCSSSVCAWGSSRPMFTDLIFESDPGGPETQVQCLTEGERQELASSEWTRAQMGTGREGQCPVGCWSLSLAQNSRPLFKGRSGCSQGQGLNRPHQEAVSSWATLSSRGPASSPLRIFCSSTCHCSPLTSPR